MAQFVLKSIDAETGCYLEQIPFSVNDPSVPAKMVGLDTMNEGVSIDLDGPQLQALAQTFNLPMQYLRNAGELHRLGDKAEFNPRSHTGRELLLLLNKEKPFAAFSVADADSDVEGIIPEDYFEPHVREGTIVKKEHIRKAGGIMPQKIRWVLYALPGEEWRINSYIALWELASVYGWNAGFEKIQGYLLGYETAIDPFFAQQSEQQ